MRLTNMISAILAGFDLANERAREDGQDRPWKVTEIKTNQFVVLATQHGKRFRVTVEEEP